MSVLNERKSHGKARKPTENGTRCAMQESLGARSNGAENNKEDSKEMERESFSLASAPVEDDTEEEFAILGATTQAVEGLISRGILNKAQPIKKAKESSKDEDARVKVGTVIETKGRTFHEKLQEALARIYAPEVTRSILGATISDDLKCRRGRSVDEANARDIQDHNEFSFKRTGGGFGIRRFSAISQTKKSDKKTLVTPQRTTWKPKGCQLRYSTLYPLPCVTKDEVGDVALKQIQTPQEVHVKPTKKSWCGCCMREALEPYSLPCGHSFCKRCIADANYFLVRDHAEEVKDKRAVMRCPLRHCRAVIPCLPLINGDFRFHLVRPEDKVSADAGHLNLCEQHRLRNYKIRVDVDMTKKKSDDLFSGFDDVIIA